MNDAPDNNLIRIVILCPPDLIKTINKIVSDSRLPTTRSRIIRELLIKQLDATSEPGVRATG